MKAVTHQPQTLHFLVLSDEDSFNAETQDERRRRKWTYFPSQSVKPHHSSIVGAKRPYWIRQNLLERQQDLMVETTHQVTMSPAQKTSFTRWTWLRWMLLFDNTLAVIRLLCFQLGLLPPTGQINYFHLWLFESKLLSGKSGIKQTQQAKADTAETLITDGNLHDWLICWIIYWARPDI